MTYKPSDPLSWGLAGDKPAERHTYDEPFAATDQPPREVEEAPAPARLPPGRCVVTCVTPVWAMRRRGLVVKHGEDWLERCACPVCGERATVELARPVVECAECGGAGHVAHVEEAIDRGPGTLRMALWAVREVLRIRPEESHERVSELAGPADLGSVAGRVTDPFARPGTSLDGAAAKEQAVSEAKECQVCDD